MENLKEYPEIQAMRMGVDYVGAIKIRDFHLRVRPLSSHEMIQLAHEVNEDLIRLPDSARNPLMEHFMLAKRTLIKATTSDVGSNDAKLTDVILNRMTMNEVLALYKEYAALEERVNPVFEKMPIDRISELVSELKKNPSQVTLLSFTELTQVVRFFLSSDASPTVN